MKPYSESCEQNRAPIFSVLEQEFSGAENVLEIGSGTGQHAVYFAPELSHLTWHTSDTKEHLPGIRLWLNEAGLNNIKGPYELNVNQNDWPVHDFDAVFSANTTHIMDWESVINMFKGIGKVLQSGGTFCLYGPFNYNGQFTSESNARFELWLKDRDPRSGIRDFEALDKLAGINGMKLKKDYEMPANNRILNWEKI